MTDSFSVFFYVVYYYGSSQKAVILSIWNQSILLEIEIKAEILNIMYHWLFRPSYLDYNLFWV